MQYARSGDAYIAYEVEGGGAIDVLLVTEGFIPIDMMFEEPRLARVLRRGRLRSRPPAATGGPSAAARR